MSNFDFLTLPLLESVLLFFSVDQKEAPNEKNRSNSESIF